MSESVSRLNGIICTLQGCGEPSAVVGLRSASDLQCGDVDRVLETFERSVASHVDDMLSIDVSSVNSFPLGLLALIEVHGVGRRAAAARRIAWYRSRLESPRRVLALQHETQDYT